MAAIGSLNLRLGVSSGDLESGLAKAQKKVESFGRTVGRTLASPLRAITGGAGVGASLAGGFLQPFQQALGSIPLAGGPLAALAGGGAGFVENIKGQMDAITQTTREANKLGIATEGLAGLQVAAGPAVDTLGTGLEHLSKELGDASRGSAEAARKFARLGLDAGELAKLPLDQALGQIADRVKDLSTPAEQMSAAFSIFTRHAGGEMLPLLQKGSAGLADAGRKAKELGLAFSALDAARVGKAQAALRTISQQVSGAFRGTAVALAPVMSEAFGGISEVLTPVLKEVGVAASAVWDVIGEGWTSIVKPFFTEMGSILGGLGLQWVDTREVILTAFEYALKGAAPFIDMLKVSGGITAKYFVGPLLSGQSLIAEGFASLLDLGSKLPGALGKELGRAADSARLLSNNMAKLSHGASVAGGKLLETRFGDTPRAVDAMFRRIREKGADAAGGADKLKSSLAGFANVLSPVQAVADAIALIGRHAAEGLGPVDAFYAKLLAAQKGFTDAAGGADRIKPLTALDFAKGVPHINDLLADAERRMAGLGKANPLDTSKADVMAAARRLGTAQQFAPALSKGGPELAKAGEALKSVFERFDAGKAGVREAQAAASDFYNELAKLADSDAFLGKRFASVTDAASNLAAQVKLLEETDLNKALGGALKQLKGELDDVLTGEGWKVLAGNRSPLDAWNKDLEKLTILLERGKISGDDFALAVVKGAEAFGKTAGLTGEVKLPGGAEYGSSAAVSAVNKFNAQDSAANQTAQIIAAMKEQMAIQKQQLEAARETVRQLRGAGIIKPMPGM